LESVHARVQGFLKELADLGPGVLLQDVVFSDGRYVANYAVDAITTTLMAYDSYSSGSQEERRLFSFSGRALVLCMLRNGVALNWWSKRSDCRDLAAQHLKFTATTLRSGRKIDQFSPNSNGASNAAWFDFETEYGELAENIRRTQAASQIRDDNEQVEDFFQATELAMGLLKGCVRRIRERREAVAGLEAQERDKSCSDAEMAARTLWQSGDVWMESGKSFSRGRSPVTGRGFYASLTLATVGHDATQHMRTLRHDPRIFGNPRRSRVRDFYHPPRGGTDTTFALRLKEVEKVYDAVAFANWCGLVLNARVTIAWFLLEGCTAKECAAMFEQLKKNLVQWLLDKGPPYSGAPWPAYVFVHETTGEDRWHTHMRFAVPPHLAAAFRREVDNALRRVIAPRIWPTADAQPGAKGRAEFLRRRVGLVKPFNPKQPTPITGDQWIGVMYMLKGADPNKEVARLDHATGSGGGYKPVFLTDLIDWTYENPGQPWIGKRVGFAEALGPTSRRMTTDADGNLFQSLLAFQLKHNAVNVLDLYSDYHLDQAEGRRSCLPLQPPAAKFPLRPIKARGHSRLPHQERLAVGCPPLSNNEAAKIFASPIPSQPPTSNQPVMMTEFATLVAQAMAEKQGD
jgi:hypothetical protein